MLRCIDVDRIVKGCRRCRVWNGLGINKKYAWFGFLKVICLLSGFLGVRIVCSQTQVLSHLVVFCNISRPRVACIV